MIKLKDVEKIYPNNIVALPKVNLNIEPAEFVCLLGKSGTGKTTLAKLLIAEESPSNGNVVIGDWDITNIRRYQIATLRKQIGVVFQDFKLLNKKTLFENVAFALEVAGKKQSFIYDVVPKLLDLVGLKERMHQYPFQVSGGEKQRACIARALSHKPRILIADEPTGNLDPQNTKDVLDLLLQINNLGATVVLITHNQYIVDNIDKRKITLGYQGIISDTKANN
jgi:cell division transport system ATP-binding protein